MAEFRDPGNWEVREKGNGMTVPGLTWRGARKDSGMNVIARSTMFRFLLNSTQGLALAAMIAAADSGVAAETNSPLAISGTNGAGFSKTTYCYKQVGDCKIQADVYRVDGSSRRPALVWIHGGALIVGNRAGPQSAQLRRCLDAGFNLISIWTKEQHDRSMAWWRLCWGWS